MPCELRMLPNEDGKPAAIEVKMSSDMPLPTPRSVICSPSHMMRPVPAVIVTTMMPMPHHVSFTMRSWQPSTSPKRAPVRTVETRVVAFSTARPSVM